MKFRNNLPDVPFDPKLLAYPFDPERHIRYKTTSLERNYQHALLTEPHLGLAGDLIDPASMARPDPGAPGFSKRGRKEKKKKGRKTCVHSLRLLYDHQMLDLPLLIKRCSTLLI